MKSDEQVLIEWSLDEINFGVSISYHDRYTRDQFEWLARAINTNNRDIAVFPYSPPDLTQAQLARELIDWTLVERVFDSQQRNMVPEITPQFLAKFWDIHELVDYAEHQRPRNFEHLSKF